VKLSPEEKPPNQRHSHIVSSLTEQTFLGIVHLARRYSGFRSHWFKRSLVFLYDSLSPKITCVFDGHFFDIQPISQIGRNLQGHAPPLGRPPVPDPFSLSFSGSPLDLSPSFTTPPYPNNFPPTSPVRSPPLEHPQKLVKLFPGKRNLKKRVSLRPPSAPTAFKMNSRFPRPPLLCFL